MTDDLVRCANGAKSLSEFPKGDKTMEKLIELNFITHKDTIPKPKPYMIPNRGDRHSITLQHFMAHRLNTLFSKGDVTKLMVGVGRMFSQMNEREAAVVARAMEGKLGMDKKEAKAYAPHLFTEDKPKKKGKVQDGLVLEIDGEEDEDLLKSSDKSMVGEVADDGSLVELKD